jgi:hypothetical protein
VPGWFSTTAGSRAGPPHAPFHAPSRRPMPASFLVKGRIPVYTQRFSLLADRRRWVRGFDHADMPAELLGRPPLLPGLNRPAIPSNQLILIATFDDIRLGQKPLDRPADPVSPPGPKTDRRGRFFRDRIFYLFCGAVLEAHHDQAPARMGITAMRPRLISSSAIEWRIRPTLVSQRSVALTECWMPTNPSTVDSGECP